MFCNMSFYIGNQTSSLLRNSSLIQRNRALCSNISIFRFSTPISLIILLILAFASRCWNLLNWSPNLICISLRWLSSFQRAILSSLRNMSCFWPFSTFLRPCSRLSFSLWMVLGLISSETLLRFLLLVTFMQLSDLVLQMIQTYWNLLRIFETTHTANSASFLYTLCITHFDFLRSLVKNLHMRTLTFHFACLTSLLFLFVNQLTCILFSSARLLLTALTFSNHDLLVSITYSIVLLIEVNSLVLRLTELNVANVSMDRRLLRTRRIATHCLRLDTLLLTAFFIGIHDV